MDYHKIFCAKKCLVQPGQKYCDFIRQVEREVWNASSIPKDPEKYINPHRPETECVPLDKTYPQMEKERVDEAMARHAL